MGEPEGDEASNHDEEQDLFGPMSGDEDMTERIDDMRDDGQPSEVQQGPDDAGAPPKEAHEPVALRNPIKPSAEDIAKHNITHLPYRDWCDVCARAVGREDPHYRRSRRRRHEQRGGLPRIALDYQELKSIPKKSPHETDVVVKMIVAKDEDTGTVFAYRVTNKGTSDTWVIKRLVKDIAELGRQDVIIKTDGEPAMLALQTAIQEARGERPSWKIRLSITRRATEPVKKPYRTSTGNSVISSSLLRPGSDSKSSSSTT